MLPCLDLLSAPVIATILSLLLILSPHQSRPAMCFSTRVAYSTVITPTGTDCKRRRERHRDNDELPMDLLLSPLTKTDAGVEQGRDVSTDVGEDICGGCN